MPIIIDHGAGNYALRNIAAGVGASVDQYRRNKLDEKADARSERIVSLEEQMFQRTLGRDKRADMESDRLFNENRRQYQEQFDYLQGRDAIGDQRYSEEMQYQKAQNAANFALRLGELMDSKKTREQERKMTELQAKLIMRQERATDADRAYMQQRGQELGLNFQPGMSPQTMFQQLQQAESQAAQVSNQESAINTLQRLMMSGAVSESSATMLTDMIEAGDTDGARRQMAALVADRAEQQHNAMIHARQMQVLTAELDERVQTTPMTSQQAAQLLSMFEVGLIDAEGVRDEIKRYDEFGVDGRTGRQGANIAGVSGKVDVPQSAIAPNPGEEIRFDSPAARYWLRVAKQTVQPAKGESDKDYEQRVRREARTLAETEGGWKTGMWLSDQDMRESETGEPEQSVSGPSSTSGAKTARGKVASSFFNVAVMGNKPLFDGTIAENIETAAMRVATELNDPNITTDQIIDLLIENSDKGSEALSDIIKQLRKG